MPRVSPPPHAARLRWEPGARDLAIVAEFPADFSFRQKLSRSAAGPLCRIPKAIAVPTRNSSLEMIERADAPGTQRASQPHSLAHDAGLGSNARWDIDQKKPPSADLRAHCNHGKGPRRRR